MDLIERIQRAMECDEEDSGKQSRLLADTYNEASSEAKKVADDLFISLCGWSLDTLINRPEEVDKVDG